MNLKDKLIQAAKHFLVCSPVVQAMFEDYGVPVEHIKDVPIEAVPLSVSAKTKNKKVYINEDLLEDGFEDDMHYIVHEVCHYLQQTTGDVLEYEDLHKHDYLDKPTELEAFSYQVQFMRDYYGNSFAEEYVDDLLDFHEYKGKKREEKRKRILGG